MTQEELSNKYFEWMCQLVCSENHSKRLPYLKLLNHLNHEEFVYTIGLDGNRADDGVDLRYRFGDESGHIGAEIATCLDNRPCSILEMMVALAIRCEEHIMDDPDIGNRTGQWFWDMIDNLGLGSMNNVNFDRVYVDEVLFRFINRKYGRNGEGGLFTVKHCHRDLRSVEIWYQMCWYLDEIL